MSGLIAEFGTGQVLWSMIWFFMFFIWIWLLIVVFSDIFRSDDMGGLAKAIWVIFVIVLPYLGVFVYLIARGHKMQDHMVSAAKAQDAAQRQYIQRRHRQQHQHRGRDRAAGRPQGQGHDHRGGVPGRQGQGPFRVLARTAPGPDTRDQHVAKTEDPP